jgi:hypothetical protein
MFYRSNGFGFPALADAVRFQVPLSRSSEWQVEFFLNAELESRSNTQFTRKIPDHR